MAKWFTRIFFLFGSAFFSAEGISKNFFVNLNALEFQTYSFLGFVLFCLQSFSTALHLHVHYNIRSIGCCWSKLYYTKFAILGKSKARAQSQYIDPVCHFIRVTTNYVTNIYCWFHFLDFSMFDNAKKLSVILVEYKVKVSMWHASTNRHRAYLWPVSLTDMYV